MSSKEHNSKFLELLTAIADAETFELELSDKKKYTFKQLTTNNLKELIKTVVDSPLTQSQFNATLTNIMRESLTNEEDISFKLLNVYDRLLFCLETRINSISPTISMFEKQVDLQSISQKLKKEIQNKPELFETQVLTKEEVTITYGIPLIETEIALNEYFQKNKNFKIENAEDLRNVLGEAFVNEIAKTLYTITINNESIELLNLDFTSRLKLIERLPAHFIQEILDFIEKYKSTIDLCLQTESGVILAVDGSLFSIR